MKIRFLGTAAAEAIPAFFCKCRVCEYARKHKKKEIRTRCQTLLNDDLLIDFGPDTLNHAVRFGIDLQEKIENCIITHAHEDHFYVDDLVYIKRGFAAITNPNPFNVYVDEAGYNMITERMSHDIEGYKDRLLIHRIKPLEEFKIKDYSITPLRANHSPTSSPVIFYIKQKDKTMLYSHDSGWYFEETFNFLSHLEKPLDLVSMDCTAGFHTIDWHDGHLSYLALLEQIKRLKEVNAIDDHTIIVANHFSHNGMATYKELKKNAKKDKVIISYDGLTINF